jgi:hypothetical protein
MTDTPTGKAGNGGDSATLLVDPVPPTATPVILTDCYVQIGTANLSCLGLEVSVEPELKPVELVTFCGVQDYPGPVKWHFKAKLAQSFDVGATDETLTDALDAYATAGTVCPFKVRAYKGRAVGPTNPSFEGNVIPQPYALFGGAAGSASEVDIDWILTAPPTKVVA